MKKTNYLKIIVVLLFSAIFNQVMAQMTAEEAVVLMGRGINMGNTLEPPMEGDWNQIAKEYYFDLYKEAGFTNVRVPVRWDNQVQKSAPYKVNAAWMDRIEEVVDWGLDRGLMVVLNCHHEESFHKDYEGQKERYDSIWSQIAVRFKDKSENLIFEMMNEPHDITQEQIEEFNVRTLGIIRQTNPTRVVVYSGTDYTGADFLMKTAIPDSEDRYLMGYYHSYDPWSFAGQGKGTWGTPDDVEEMKERILGVQKWSKENNMPIYLGEFGAQRLCDYNSRMFYYAKATEFALAYDHCFSAWDDGGMFKTLLRIDKKWNDIKDVLMYSSSTSITDLKVALVDNNVKLNWKPRSDSDLISKVLVEKRSEDTEFSVIAEFSDVSTTTVPLEYLDKLAEKDAYSYYRLVEVYSNNDRVLSYPIRIFNGVIQSVSKK